MLVNIGFDWVYLFGNGCKDGWLESDWFVFYLFVLCFWF